MSSRVKCLLLLLTLRTYRACCRRCDFGITEYGPVCGRNWTCTMRPGRRVISPQSKITEPKQGCILQDGKKHRHPSHIPAHFPQFPDPHAYICTHTYKQPVSMKRHPLRRDALNELWWSLWPKPVSHAPSSTPRTAYFHWYLANSKLPRIVKHHWRPCNTQKWRVLSCHCFQTPIVRCSTWTIMRWQGGIRSRRHRQPLLAALRVATYYRRETITIG
jgi:hypothetical protein